MVAYLEKAKTGTNIEEGDFNKLDVLVDEAVSTISVQEASITIPEVILFLLGVKRMKEGKTAFGKDFSNPLIGDSLLKTIWFSSHHASKVKSWLVQRNSTWQRLLKSVDG
nr:hypothetical protein [Tanacetum cinerariifolium]